MHFAFICPPYAGHLNPMFAVGSVLRARGHRVTFLALEDIAPAIAAAGFAVQPVGRASHPRGTLVQLERRLAALRGMAGVLAVIRDVAHMTDMLCRDAPAALERLQPHALVCDQLEPAGGLLAQRYRVPHVSVANALMIDREPYVPPPFTDWRYARTRWARERNLGGYRVADWLMREVSSVIAHRAAAWRLPPRARAEQCLSAVQVGQLVPEIDFPRESLPGGFRYTGPLRKPLDEEPAWNAPARPFVFVSLGTLQGGRFALLARITRACRDAGLTAVVAHGGKLTPQQAAALPGAPVVEAFFPQRRVIAQAELVITHGGLNTALDALALGVPLVLLPLAMEQGATAQRVVRAGAGLRLRARFASVRTLRKAIAEVLGKPGYRRQAAALARALGEAGGAARAAEVIERHAAA